MRECLGRHLDGCNFSLKYHSEWRQASGSFCDDNTLPIDNKSRTGMVLGLAAISKDIDLGEWGVRGRVEAVE